VLQSINTLYIGSLTSLYFILDPSLTQSQPKSADLLRTQGNATHVPLKIQAINNRRS
jgi:hypothetical protein